MISVSDFEKVEMRVGTVLEVKDNKKSRNPAYVVTIDFGGELGIKKSSAQITALYKPEDLIGHSVIVVTNLEPRMLRGIESRGMILMAKQGDGSMRFITPEEAVCNGAQVG